MTETGGREGRKSVPTRDRAPSGLFTESVEGDVDNWGGVGASENMGRRGGGGGGGGMGDGEVGREDGEGSKD